MKSLETKYLNISSRIIENYRGGGGGKKSILEKEFLNEGEGRETAWSNTMDNEIPEKIN